VEQLEKALKKFELKDSIEKTQENAMTSRVLIGIASVVVCSIIILDVSDSGNATQQIMA
jgi:hypothetical protein